MRLKAANFTGAFLPLRSRCVRRRRGERRRGAGRAPDRAYAHHSPGKRRGQDRAGGPRLTDAGAPWVECIPERVRKVVQADQENGQRHAGPEAEPGRLAEVGTTLTQHRAPGWIRWLRAKAEEREPGLGERRE